jgi:NADH-quinone oxidoreductase subunit M
MLVEALILACLVGSAVVTFVPDRYAGRLALAVSALPVVGSLYMYAAFDGSGNALLGSEIPSSPMW